MMKTVRARMGKSEEEGFTLIELMVVVLILGILMAIAIPTFLSLTSSAKSNAAQSDLTVAAQDEATYFTQNGNYGATTEGATTYASIPVANVANMKGIDTGLNYSTAATAAWSTTLAAGTKAVFISPSSTATNEILGTAAQNGNVYWINDNQGTITYAITTNAVNTAPVSGDFSYQSWGALNTAASATSFTVPTT